MQSTGAAPAASGSNTGGAYIINISGVNVDLNAAYNSATAQTDDATGQSSAGTGNNNQLNSNFTLIQPTSFDQTTLGSFSLFNLVNGNIASYATEGLATKGIAAGFAAALNALSPGAGTAAASVVTPVAIGVGALATAVDAGTIWATKAINEATNNLPVNPPTSGSPGVNMGGGIYWQEEWP